MNTINKRLAFTLVELIVVIVILAILATIAFLSFGSQSSSARDSTRLSDLSSIGKGLTLQNAKSGLYPVPDKNIIISSGSILIGYQGEAGDGIKSTIKAPADGLKDPLDKVNYIYATNSSKNKYQLLAFLENKDSVVLDYVKPSVISALDYSNRIPFSRGDSLGIILVQTGSTLTPLQQSNIISSGSGFEINTPEIYTGSVVILNNTDPLTDASLISYVGYTSTGSSIVLNPLPDACNSGATVKTLSYGDSVLNLKNRDLLFNSLNSGSNNFLGCKISGYPGEIGLATIIGTGSDAKILVSYSIDSSTGILWASANTEQNNFVSGVANDLINGYDNSLKISNSNLNNYPGAKLCWSMSNADLGTWFLPSKSEMAMIYQNRVNIGLSGLYRFGFMTSSEYSKTAFHSHYFYDNSVSNGLRSNPSFAVRCVSRF